MNDAGTAKGRRALVLYGSETGNAHDIADEIGRMTERVRFSTQVTNLNAIETTALLDYSVILIAISTTGQGDLPNNARVFWRKILRKKLPPTHLHGVQFAAFGLGDSSYPKYNWAVRKLHRRLTQIGATELLPRGEGDEQDPEGYDASFIPWLQSLREQLLIHFSLEAGVEPISDDCLLPPKWKLGLTPKSYGLKGQSLALAAKTSVGIQLGNGDEKHDITAINARASNTYLDSGQHVDVVLQENKRITPSVHWQDVRHITLSASQYHTYAPGDVLTIYPENSKEDVDQILNLMRWEDVADLPITYILSENTRNKLETLPAVVRSNLNWKPTLRALLTNNLDLNAIPRRSFFSLVSHFTDDTLQKERLLELSKPEFLDELYDYTTRPRRSILEVLQEFDTVKIPWEWAATILPELRGRQFSIASGGSLKHGKDNSTMFELLVAIVKYKTVIKKIRQGVCTRYLANLSPGTPLRVSLRTGDLGTNTSDAKRPVVMVAPGTGVAPMRSLIWERKNWISNSQAKGAELEALGENILFFGCRTSQADFFFSDEWEGLKQKMPLQVFTAFSRDQRTKIYVQDLIKEQSLLVYRLLHDDNAMIYVCGSSGKMPQAVRESLVESFQQAGGMTREAAEAYFAQMERESRYRQETW